MINRSKKIIENAKEPAPRSRAIPGQVADMMNQADMLRQEKKKGGCVSNNRQGSRDLKLIHIPLSVRYALEGMGDLARHYGTGYRQAERSARRCGLPAEYLLKIFHRLASRKLLESRRGPGGGFTLTRKPRDIRVVEILEALDRFNPITSQCLLGQRLCGSDNVCPIHATVVGVERVLMSRLRAMSLAELAGITSSQ